MLWHLPLSTCCCGDRGTFAEINIQSSEGPPDPDINTREAPLPHPARHALPLISSTGNPSRPRPGFEAAGALFLKLWATPPDHALAPCRERDTRRRAARQRVPPHCAPCCIPPSCSFPQVIRSRYRHRVQRISSGYRHRHLKDLKDHPLREGRVVGPSWEKLKPKGPKGSTAGPKGRRALLRTPSTAGRSVCPCREHSKSKGPKGSVCLCWAPSKPKGPRVQSSPYEINEYIT